MKKLLVFLILFAASASAQEITLTTPVAPPSEAKYTIQGFKIVRSPTPYAVIDVDVKSSANVVLRSFRVELPDSAHPTATVLALVTATITVRATETGNDARKLDFRISGFLLDQGYLPAVTVVP